MKIIIWLVISAIVLLLGKIQVWTFDRSFSNSLQGFIPISFKGITLHTCIIEKDSKESVSLKFSLYPFCSLNVWFYAYVRDSKETIVIEKERYIL